MRSRYDVMRTSIVKDTDGQNFPDPISFPANRFYTDDNTIKINISKINIISPYKLMAQIYGEAEYDDILFWLNNVCFIPDLEEGFEIEIPSKFALENFILKNRQG